MEEDNLVVPVGRQEPVGSEEPSVEPSLEPLPPTASSPSLPSKPSLAPRAVAPSAPVTPELLVAPAPAPAAGPGETAPEGYSYCFQHSPEGALFAAADVLASGEVPSRAEIREHISGNYCRCTGYEAVVDAIETVARSRAGGGEASA